MKDPRWRYGLKQDEMMEQEERPEPFRPAPGKVTRTSKLPPRPADAREASGDRDVPVGALTGMGAAEPASRAGSRTVRVPSDPSAHGAEGGAEKSRLATLGAELGADLFEAALASGQKEQIVWQALLRRGAGRALPRELASKLEEQLAVALGDVRVHDDAASQAAVRALGVAAFTFGRDIFLGDAHASDLLLAHEAAHAAQHAGATPDHVSVNGEATPSIAIEEDEGVEDWADRAAASLFTGARMQVPVAAPAVRFRGGGIDPVAIISRAMGSDEGEARAMLQRAGSQGRGSVEAAIRRNFDPEKAEELITGTPVSSAQPPKVNAKPAGKPKAKPTPPPPLAVQMARALGAAVVKAVVKATAAAKGDAPPDADAAPADPAAVGELGLSPADLTLIHSELIEHERWASALGLVGKARSGERANFIADQVGGGMYTGLGTGGLMAFGGAWASGLAHVALPKVPGVGAIIAGGWSAYALFKKDWGEANATINKFGTGASKYEVFANSLAAVSEVLDIMVNVANVMAGIVGVISALMWLVTIITVGAAAPLAATLSAMAFDLVAVTGLIDDLNKSVLQTLVMLFRSMHAFYSEADPRDIEQQGAGIFKASSEVGGYFGSKGGGLAGTAMFKPKAMPTGQEPGKQEPGTPKVDEPPAAFPTKEEIKAMPWREKVKTGLAHARAEIQVSRAELGTARPRADQANANRKQLEANQRNEIAKAREQARQDTLQKIEAERRSRQEKIDGELDRRLQEIDRTPETAETVRNETVAAAEQTLTSETQAASDRQQAAIDAATETRTAEVEAIRAPYDQAVTDRIAEREAIFRAAQRERTAANHIPDPAMRGEVVRAVAEQTQLDLKAADQKLRDVVATTKESLRAANRRRDAAKAEAARAYEQELAAARQRRDDSVAAAEAAMQRLKADHAQHGDDWKSEARTDAHAERKELWRDSQAQANAEVPAAMADAQATTQADLAARIDEQKGIAAAAKDELDIHPQKIEGDVKNLTENVFKQLTGAVEAKAGAVWTPYEPQYRDPPDATLPHLEAIRQQIEADLATAAQAAELQLEMQTERAAAVKSDAELRKMQLESEDAIAAIDAHQAAVQRKTDAINEQKARQERGEAMFVDWGQRQAGFLSLRAGLKAFQGFTWIGQELGSSDFEQLHREGVQFEHDLNSAQAMVTTEQGKQPVTRAQILGDAATAQTTQQQGAVSATDAASADQGVRDVTARNQETITAAGELGAEAGALRMAKTIAAAAQKAQYQVMAQALKTWALEHQQARTAAQTAQAQAATPAETAAVVADDDASWAVVDFGA